MATSISEEAKEPFEDLTLDYALKNDTSLLDAKDFLESHMSAEINLSEIEQMRIECKL